MKYNNVYFINGLAYAGKSTMVKMLANPDILVKRFFERPDKEKQFLYKLLITEENAEKALDNFRECLKRINTIETYNKFLNSEFKVIIRDENITIEETLILVKKAFKLR